MGAAGDRMLTQVNLLGLWCQGQQRRHILGQPLQHTGHPKPKLSPSWEAALWQTLLQPCCALKLQQEWAGADHSVHLQWCPGQRGCSHVCSCSSVHQVHLHWFKGKWTLKRWALLPYFGICVALEMWQLRFLAFILVWGVSLVGCC